MKSLIDFIRSQSVTVVNRRVLISCATEVLSLFRDTVASHFGLVEESFLCDSLNNGRENLDRNVWIKPPHKALDSLRAIAFLLPDHGSGLSGPSGVWGGFTSFMLLLSLKGIYWCWSSVQVEHCFGTARPQQQTHVERDLFRIRLHSQHLSWTTCDATDT